MPPTLSARRAAGCWPILHAGLWPSWIAAPLVFFSALAPGCQSERQSSSHRLPPEKELQQYADETPQTSIDPRRLSQEELETRDGVKALKDVEKNGVKIRE